MLPAVWRQLTTLGTNSHSMKQRPALRGPITQPSRQIYEYSLLESGDCACPRQIYEYSLLESGDCACRNAGREVRLIGECRMEAVHSTTSCCPCFGSTT